MKKIKFKLSALTLIEVLISIAVFSIGILSVSYLIISNVWLSERTKLKTTATMLAKEGIELVYNRRDTNIKKGWIRSCLKLKEGSYAGECEVYFHDPDKLEWASSRTLQVDEAWNYQFNSISSSQDNTYLYYKKSKVGENYVYTSWKSKNNIISTQEEIKKRIFSRIITFTPVYLSEEESKAHPDKILKVTSTVKYKKGRNYSGSVTIQSFIWDTLDTIALDPYSIQ